MKKILSLLLIISILSSFIIACEKDEPLDYTLKFGTLPAESAIPIIIAKEKGFYEKEGLSVEIVPFNSPNDRNVAVQAKKIDAIIGDVMTSLTFHQADFDMKITSDINEDFKLLTSPNSGITTVENLNNKDVSLVPNFVLEYIMDKIAEENNIEYNLVSIPSFTARFEALLADEIDGVIFTEPQATLLESKGANIIASSRDYGIKAGTLLFNGETLDTHPAEIKAFYRAYNNAVDYINDTDPTEYSNVLNEYGFPPAIEDYLKSEPTYTKAQEISNDTFKDVLKWTQSKNLIDKEYKLEDISDFSFIE